MAMQTLTRTVTIQNSLPPNTCPTCMQNSKTVAFLIVAMRCRFHCKYFYASTYCYYFITPLALVQLKPLPSLSILDLLTLLDIRPLAINLIADSLARRCFTLSNTKSRQQFKK